MNIKIYNWQDISEKFSDSILLGNGASISINKSFTYDSLKEYAATNGLFNSSINSLFDFFKTSDFELILRLVWHATKVNEALGIADSETEKAYEHVRDCLINTIQRIHPEHIEVRDQFLAITNFLSSFKTVLSLNYDLTLYWVMMYAKDLDNNHMFKDCMINGEFKSDWQGLRKSVNHRFQNTSLVFYPHGSLVLARNVAEQEVKLVSDKDDDLLESILKYWRSSDYIPLFVSEGTSNQKIAAIKNSYYLSIIYREVIPSIVDNLTIFGWGFGEEDIHILEKLKDSCVKRIAVSVYNNDQEYCRTVTQMIHDHIGRNIEITFFDSESNGCWNK